MYDYYHFSINLRKMSLLAALKEPAALGKIYVKEYLFVFQTEDHIENKKI